MSLFFILISECAVRKAHARLESECYIAAGYINALFMDKKVKCEVPLQA
jgi:hypothetical protein